MDQRVRGSVINGYFKFIQKKWGKEGLNNCLSDLGLEDNIKDGKYYHGQITENILRWLSREKGMEYAAEAGKFVVQNLGILKWLVRFASIKTVANKFPENYSEVYTHGHVEVDTEQDHQIFIRLFDVNQIKESCSAWQGVCEGVLALSKTKGTVRKTKCQMKGDNCCEYTIELI